MQIMAERAVEALGTLSEPDCVFVGGSGGGMCRILALAKEKNPAVRVVVTAIALETLEEARHALLDLGFANVQVSQPAASRGTAVGTPTMIAAVTPVFSTS